MQSSYVHANWRGESYPRNVGKSWAGKGISERLYRVLCVHEVWHFEKQSSELFKDYVDTFLKLKQESSWYPKECTTEEEKLEYVQQYFEHEEIYLGMSKIEHNPG